MSRINWHYGVQAGGGGPQPNVANPKRDAATRRQPAAQIPLGQWQQHPIRRPAGGMAPQNGRPPEGRFQNGDAGRMPAGPLPQFLPQAMPEARFPGHHQVPPQPVPQQAAQARPAIFQVLLPYGPQVPLRPTPPWQPVPQRPMPQEMAQGGQAMFQALHPYGPQVPPRPVPPWQPVGQWPTPQEAARVRPANPHAVNPGQPQVPPRPWHAAPMPIPVAANHVQPQAWQQPAPGGRPQWPMQVQNPGAYPVNVRPLRHAQQRAMNVPAGTLPANIGRLYQELNLKVTDDTRPAFTNANLMARPTTLGTGAYNTVFAVKLQKADGATFDGVFKPLGTQENGWVAAATGIPKHDPQIAMRNIATLSYAQKLGIDVIPDTRVAVLDTGPGQVEGPKLGLVMERASGNEAAKANLALFNRADVRAEVTKLQLLDHLTGQGDRHGCNYFIDIGQSGKAKVTGIDNDQCFGARLTNPNGIQYAHNRTNYGFRGTSLPPVVDTEMAAKIKSLTHHDIREMLGNKLSEPEVQAAIARHEGVKQHIAGLEAQRRVIRPSDWSHPGVGNLLTAQNSYVGRERDCAFAAQAQARAAGLAGRQPNAAWQ